MKIREPLMLAYIIFLLICILFRNSIEKEMWGAIVVSVGCSSAILAIGDYFYLAVEFGKNSQKFLKQIEIFIKDVDKMEILVENKLSETINDEDVVKYKQMLKSMEEIRKILISIKTMLSNKIKSVYKFGWYVDVCKILSFIVFFSLIVFNFITEKLNDIQEMLTVQSFAVILITQYFKTSFDKDFKECWECVEESRGQLNALKRKVGDV